MSGAEWDGKMPEGDVPLVETTVTLAKVIWPECPECGHVNDASEDSWSASPADALCMCGNCSVKLSKSRWVEANGFQE